MVASVRLYNVALAAINDECLQAKLGEDSTAIAYILANSVRKITSKEFERSNLSQHIQMHVLEFMAMELSLEEQRDNRLLRKDVEKEEAARRQRLVAVSYALVDPNSYLGIDRDRTMLLVGPRLVLQEITGAAMSVANINKQTAVRLLDTMQQNTNVSRKATTNQWRFELGQQHWLNFASSHRKVGELLNRLAHHLRGNRLDLLIVEDLSQAQEASSALPVQLRANNAQRTIRKYADSNGVAVICCLPMEEDPDPSDKAWERLEVYTDLRFVSKDANDNIKIETRGGDSWLGIPEISLGDLDEHDSSGLQVQTARECDSPDSGAGTSEGVQEAGGH